MNKEQFEKFMSHLTGRPLELLDIKAEDSIPLDKKLQVFRPYNHRGKTHTLAFQWKTPKKEDSLCKSFITAFCSKYQEPDPANYDYDRPHYGNTWQDKYKEQWETPETHWNCALWHHHSSNMLSKEKLRYQVETNAEGLSSDIWKNGFYATHYGIGIFSLFGGKAVHEAIKDMRDKLEQKGIPFRNEMSNALWVTRFVINLDKKTHANILTNNHYEH